MIEFILMFGVRIIVGILFLIAGILTYSILRSKRLPVLVSIGALIYGVWSIASALINAYIMYSAVESENIRMHMSYIALLNSILSVVGIVMLLLFTILFIVGIYEIARRVQLSQNI